MKSRQKHFFMILNSFAFLLIVTMSNFALIDHVHFYRGSPLAFLLRMTLSKYN